jgi:tetratricopeptide (TPR) repeat protein
MTTMGNLEHARRREMTGYFFKTIDRIEFIRRAAFIWKKAQDQNDALAITAMKELVERSGSAQNWFHFASYCLSRGGSPQEVALAARKAISLNGKWGLPHWRLSQALIQLDDLSGALAAAEQAVALDPKLSAQLKPRIDDLRRRLRVSNSQS